jgi:lipoprotein-anchoring transpeptidase ErfK/SrfK
VRRSKGILVAIAAAITAAAIAAGVLLATSGGSGSPTKQAAPRPATRPTKPKPAVKEHPRAAPKAKTRGRKPRVAAPKRTQPRPARAVPLPRTSSRKLPWRRTGISEVARAVNRHLAVYGRPGAKRATVLLQNPDRLGVPRVLLVHSQRKHWIRLYMPTRPDGRTGWVRRRAVRLFRNPYRIVVHLRSHRLELWRSKRRVLKTGIVAGAPATPTPRGLYYVTQLLKPPDPNGAYGPFSFGLSAHSRVLKRFAGGNGQVGIHGTNQPGLIGSSVSHGCVRVNNGAIRRLARVLPLGTPVLIRS